MPKGVEPRHPVGRIHDRRNPSLPYTLAVCGYFVTPRCPPTWNASKNSPRISPSCAKATRPSHHRRPHHTRNECRAPCGEAAQALSTDEAFDRIVRPTLRDCRYLPTKWITDDEVKKIRAETKYRSGNCALIK